MAPSSTSLELLAENRWMLPQIVDTMSQYTYLWDISCLHIVNSRGYEN